MTNENTTDAPALRPVNESERIKTLDVLRGFAIFGIFMVNIQFFAMPMMVGAGMADVHGGPVGERIATGIVKAFFEFKFVSTFSFLFGAGLVMQYQRAKAKGRPFAGPFTRRTLLLLAIGTVHALGFWYGDILFIYAWCALAAVFAVGWRASLQLKIAIGLLVVSLALTLGFGVLGMVSQQAASNNLVAADTSSETENVSDSAALDDSTAQAEPEEVAPSTSDRVTDWDTLFDEVNWNSQAWDGFAELETFSYREGPMSATLKTRGITWSIMMIFTIFGGFAVRILAMFLFGMACMSSGFFSADKMGLHKKLMIAGLGIGIPGELAFAYCAVEVYSLSDLLPMLFLNTSHAVTSFFLCFGYIGTICVITNSGVLRWLTSSLANVGRLALTNYLAQTLIATFVMYWWGFAQFGQWTRVEQLSFVIGIYVGQIVLSAIWLRFFRMGPLEWIWRSATYLKLQPILRR